MPWRQLVFRDAPRRVQAPRVPRSMVAGVVVLVAAGAGVAGWWHLPIARGIQTTPVGETRTIELPDGSRATLSSASRVRWAMSRSQRTIELEQGEVFVDVAADANRVFVVAAGSDRAVAIGTRFSVRKADRGTRVVVTEGRVRFSSTGGAAPAVLQPGMVAVAGGSELRVESMPLDQAEGLLSWREGYLGFRNTPLAEAVAEFNRYNTRRLVIADPAIATIPIGGNFRWNNIDVFVRLLEQGFELRAEMRDRDIVLHAR